MAQVLVVDDESAVRGALVAHLQEMGHRCEEAGNGLEALERLARSEVDLILTDVAMPRMNGLQFLERALPYLEQRIPIVLLSSVDDRRAISAAVGAGAHDYLTKPADIDEVRRVVERALSVRSEVLRVHGRRRGPGGPIPRSATAEAPRDRREAAVSQRPAGVPAFRGPPSRFTIPRPPGSGEESDAGGTQGLLARMRRWIGRRVA